MNYEDIDPRKLITPKEMIDNNVCRRRTLDIQFDKKTIIETNLSSYGYLVGEMIRNTKNTFEINYRKMLYFLYRYEYYYSLYPGNKEMDITMLEALKVTSDRFNVPEYKLWITDFPYVSFTTWITDFPYVSFTTCKLLNSFLMEKRLWEGTGLWDFISTYDIKFFYSDPLDNYEYNFKKYIIADHDKPFGNLYYQIINNDLSKNLIFIKEFDTISSLVIPFHYFRTERY